MNEQELWTLLEEARQAMGVASTPFSCAVTVEAVRRGLADHGIATSAKGAFIAGVSVEFDLLIPKAGAMPEYGMLYYPDEVLAALKVGCMGAQRRSSCADLKTNFQRVRSRNPEIFCAYVTLTERLGYKDQVTTENLGWPAYTLFYHSGAGNNLLLTSTGDWERLVRALQNLSSLVAVAA
ncbi:MAG TPA: hypothetical protein VGM23_12845 [Armatimonadota bacterium]